MKPLWDRNRINRPELREAQNKGHPIRPALFNVLLDAAMTNVKVFFFAFDKTRTYKRVSVNIKDKLFHFKCTDDVPPNKSLTV